MRRLALAAVLGCCLLGLQSQALAAPGDVDPSFGSSGVVETPQALRAGHFRETALGMAIGPKDEIFVLGMVPQLCQGGCPLDLEVTWYGRNGALDRSFGSGGRTVLTVRPGQDVRVAASIAVGKDGRPVIATTDGSDISLFRLASRGGLDAGFGSGGIVRSNLAGPDQAAGVAVAAGGAIVVAGTRETPTEGTLPLLLRYSASGAPDAGFGEGGIRYLTFAPDDYPAGLALPAGERIAVGLSDCCYATGRALIARLTAGGQLDHGFAGQGWRSVGRLAPVRVVSVMPARKGRLVLIGVYGGQGSNDVFAARFPADGRLDRHFGKRGLVRPEAPLPRRDFAASAVDGAGRLLFASRTRTSAETFGLTRLRVDGRLDLTFAGGSAGGIPGIERTQAVALQSNGRIVVLGEAGECSRTCPPTRMVLARYLGGSSGARCAGGRATVVGTRRSERLEGTPRRDVIAGLGGDDRIFGLGGNDLVCGGGGNDRLVGGSGRDRLVGGPGRNTRRQ